MYTSVPNVIIKLPLLSKSRDRATTMSASWALDLERLCRLVLLIPRLQPSSGKSWVQKNMDFSMNGRGLFFRTNERLSSSSEKQAMCHFWENLFVQWGLEYQTRSQFQWSPSVRFPNGIPFWTKWWPFSLDFQWFSFSSQDHSYSYCYDQPFQNRTIGNVNFKTFGIPMCPSFQYSSPHCNYVTKTNWSFWNWFQ